MKDTDKFFVFVMKAMARIARIVGYGLILTGIMPGVIVLLMSELIMMLIDGFE